MSGQEASPESSSMFMKEFNIESRIAEQKSFVVVSDLHSLYQFTPILANEGEYHKEDLIQKAYKLKGDEPLVRRSAELMPSADFLIIAGDFTNHGAKHDVEHFLSWIQLLSSKYHHMIVIAGNHEQTFDAKHSTYSPKIVDLLTSNMPGNCYYLLDQAIELEGIKFYGTPFVNPCGNWGFWRRGTELKSIYSKIPEDIDVLITHMPPYGILDEAGKNPFHDNPHHIGNRSLAEIVRQRRPILHVFGHIHEGYGTEIDGDTIYCNGAFCDWSNSPRNPPQRLNLIPRKDGIQQPRLVPDPETETVNHDQDAGFCSIQ